MPDARGRKISPTCRKSVSRRARHPAAPPETARLPAGSRGMPSLSRKGPARGTGLFPRHGCSCCSGGGTGRSLYLKGVPKPCICPGRGAAPVPMRLTGMSRLTIMPGSPGRCTGCPRQKNRGRPRTGRFPDKREAVFIRICQRHSSNAGGAGNVPGPGRSRDAAAKKTGEGPSAGIPWKRHEGLLSRELRERARTKPVKCRRICKAGGGGSALCPRFGKTPH